jgi:hypothetical protein
MSTQIRSNKSAKFLLHRLPELAPITTWSENIYLSFAWLAAWLISLGCGVGAAAAVLWMTTQVVQSSGGANSLGFMVAPWFAAAAVGCLVTFALGQTLYEAAEHWILRKTHHHHLPF